MFPRIHKTFENQSILRNHYLNLLFIDNQFDSHSKASQSPINTPEKWNIQKENIFLLNKKILFV